jgi:hypothetical protein
MYAHSYINIHPIEFLLYAHSYINIYAGPFEFLQYKLMKYIYRL